MKKRLSMVLILILIMSLFMAACPAPTENMTPSASYTQMCKAHEIAETARALGLPETDSIIVRAQELWWQANAQYESDRDIIACVIFNEAWGGCTDRHRELVGAVVLNRANMWEQSVYDVVTARNQYCTLYATVGSFYWNKASADPETWSHCQELAEKVLRGEVTCPPNVLFQAESKQGDVYEVCKTSYSTTYFCYG